MEGLDLETEIKAAAKTLNKDTVKQMEKCILDLTTSGSPSLDVELAKKFKRFCRQSDNYVRYAFLLIMRQLTKKHSEIRLSAFQVVDELFNRSHAFRDLLITHLHSYVALTTGIEAEGQLPPPKSAASRLKTEAIHALQRWYDKYGKGYKKLAIGYDYLQNSKHVDFNEMRAQNEAERRRVENEEKRKQKIMTDKLAKVLTSISELRPEIENCVKEAESCLKLLLPTLDDFILPSADEATDRPAGHHKDLADKESQLIKEDNSILPSVDEVIGKLKDGHVDLTGKENLQIKEDDLKSKDGVRTESVSDEDDEMSDMVEEEDDDLHAHGLPNPSFSLVIELPAPGPVSVKVTADNDDLVRTLGEAGKLIAGSYLPKVTKWLEVLTKNGANQADIKAAIDLKVSLEEVRMKCVELNLVSDVPHPKMKDDDDDSDEEEFEEVPEKEGYEPHIPAHLRVEYGLSELPSSTKSVSQPSSSSSSTNKSSSLSSKTSGKANKQKKTQAISKHWSLKERASTEDVSDPTSLASALARVKSESSQSDHRDTPSTSGMPGTSRDDQKVPVVQFGTDLAYWNNPDQIEAPSIVKFDSLHRFWTPKEAENEKPSQQDLAAVKNRTFFFTGKFEPVKWQCRALMPSGKLCQRMDRIKCPFHGKIIPRDKCGKPNGPSVSAANDEVNIKQDKSGDDAEDNNGELPPWQDPELQREIEQATGHDLGSVRSQKLLDKKGKGKRKKKSGLTDIKALNNTTRKRLGDKIFDKRSMKRVCSRLDNSDYKRVRDKFANQFNYSLH